MSDREQDPLTPEERALAQRLARLDAAAEPSPALDARILSAARASTPTAGVTGRRDGRGYRRMRWPVGLGLAASLALAVGIAWQVRPLPDTHIQYSQAPAAVVPRPLDPLGPVDAVTSDAGKSVVVESLMDTDSAPRQLSETSAGEPVAREQVAASTKRESEPESDAAAAPTAEKEIGNFVPDAATPIGPPKPEPLPASPPPPAPTLPQTAPSVMPARQPAVSPADSAVAKDAEENIRERKASSKRSDAFAGEAAARAKAETQARTQAAESRIKQAGADETSDLIFDQAPPASADSPEVRAAWLARIRELVAEGDFDAARESLLEFLRRYPRAQVPHDLRPLLE